MSVHVCSPRTVTFRVVAYCPTCRCRRRFVSARAIWWGAIHTCCSCGDSWDSDGERLSRPFTRGWRTAAASKAKSEWATAPSRDEAEARWRWMLAEEFGEDQA